MNSNSTVVVPKVKNTKQYAKFELPFNREAVQLAATIYVPLEQADPNVVGYNLVPIFKTAAVPVNKAKNGKRAA